MRLSLTICRSASRSEHQKDDHDQYGHRLQYHAIDHQLVLALAADILAGRHQPDPAHQYEKCGKRPARDQNEEEAIHASGTTLFEIGRASCRERVCQCVYMSVVAV